MILTKSQMRRFVSASGDLVAYVADKTGRFRDLFPVIGGEPSNEVMGEIADWIWGGHTRVIAEFVAQNPSGLPEEDLREVARWQECGLVSEFPVVEDHGNTVFVCEDHAIVVSGLTQEPAALLHGVPSYVHAVLVPFEDRVVYVQTLSEYPVAMGEGMQKMLRDELERMRDEGKLLSTADDFVAALPAIRADKVKARERSAADAEFQKSGPSQAYLDGLEGMPAGQHRGKLAGLPWEERQKAVELHLHMQLFRSFLPGLDRDVTLKGTLPHDLRGILASRNKEVVTTTARVAGMSGYSKLRKQELVDALADFIMRDPQHYLKAMLDRSSVEELRLLRRVVEAGGVLEAGESDDVDAWLYHKSSADLLPAVFKWADGAACVVPSELLEYAQAMDWDATVAARECGEAGLQWDSNGMPDANAPEVDAVHYAEQLVALRGVVRVATAAEGFAAYDQGIRPDQLGSEDLRLVQQAAQDMADAWGDEAMIGYELLDDGRDLYLLEPTLAEDNWYYLTGKVARARLGYDPGYPGRKLSSEVRQLMRRRERLVARSLPADLAEADGYIEWLLDLPPVRTLALYLDAHVPDGGDDYLYAEDMLNILVDSTRGPLRFAELMQDLGDLKAFVDENGMRAVGWLVTNALNAMPSWENNGWSPEEARRMESMKVVEGGRRQKKPRPRKKGRKR